MLMWYRDWNTLPSLMSFFFIALEIQTYFALLISNISDILGDPSSLFLWLQFICKGTFIVSLLRSRPWARAHSGVFHTIHVEADVPEFHSYLCHLRRLWPWELVCCPCLFPMCKLSFCVMHGSECPEINRSLELYFGNF